MRRLFVKILKANNAIKLHSENIDMLKKNVNGSLSLFELTKSNIQFPQNGDQFVCVKMELYMNTMITLSSYRFKVGILVTMTMYVLNLCREINIH